MSDGRLCSNNSASGGERPLYYNNIITSIEMLFVALCAYYNILTNLNGKTTATLPGYAEYSPRPWWSRDRRRLPPAYRCWRPSPTHRTSKPCRRTWLLGCEQNANVSIEWSAIIFLIISLSRWTNIRFDKIFRILRNFIILPLIL